MIAAETPCRTAIQSEIKPFRGLLPGFFLISLGLDPGRIGQWMRREQERVLAGRQAVAA